MSDHSEDPQVGLLLIFFLLKFTGFVFISCSFLIPRFKCFYF